MTPTPIAPTDNRPLSGEALQTAVEAQPEGATVTERIVVVEVKNEILGDSEFWRGPESRISAIRNIPARDTARLVVKDGKQRKCGMWHVRIEPSKDQP